MYSVVRETKRRARKAIKPPAKRVIPDKRAKLRSRQWTKDLRDKDGYWEAPNDTN